MLLAPWLILLSPRVRPMRDEALTGRLHALASRAQLRLAGLHEWVFGPHGDHANAALVGVIGPRRLLISELDRRMSAGGDGCRGGARARTSRARAHLATGPQPGDEPGDCRPRGAGECGGAGALDGRHLRAHRSGIVALDAPGGRRGVARDAAMAAGPVRVHEAEADAFALALTGRPMSWSASSCASARATCPATTTRG